MASPSSTGDDHALVFQQQIRSFRESLNSETKSHPGAEDRISKLPDGILHHILSFIPSKEVVRTSILATRWKNIWAYAPRLTLNDEEFHSSAEFIAFVDRALLIRDSAAIQIFHLNFKSCRVEDFPIVDRWLCTAVRCNVVELSLSIGLNSDGQIFELPRSLLNCKTLKVWKLSANEILKLPSSFCYPSLKFLHVTFSNPTILNPDNNSMDVSHCPVLEYLKIDGEVGSVGFNWNISALALKTLSISLGGDYDPREANFLINSPKLEKLDVSEDELSNYTFQNTQSLVEANIRVFARADVDTADVDNSGNHATKFLAGISGVKCLALRTPFYTGCSLPFFENLSKLELDCADRRWWKHLMMFLERSPNLESFFIYKSYCLRGEAGKKIVHTEKRSPNLECFVLYKERKLYPHEKEAVVARRLRLKPKPGCLDVEVVKDVIHWSPPTVVPKCLLSSLKTICICGFQGKDYFGYLDEMELIKYLLKHGQALEFMAIHTSEVLLTKRCTPDHLSGTKEEFCNEITVSELGSKSVQVQFFENKLYRW